MGSVRGRAVVGVGVLVLVAATTVPTAAAATRAAPWDFNGDGYADLAVGIPGEDLGSHVDSGAVQAIYGSSAGLTASGNQLWTLSSRGVPGSPRTDDLFGTTASGDFNGDGYADLAVGASGRRVGSRPNAGTVTVLYGSRRGLTSRGSWTFSQATRGVPGSPDAYGHFGGALASGDFDGNGRDDLAIGAPFDSIGADKNQQGSVTVLLGSRRGLRTVGAQEWDTGSILGRGLGLTGSALDAGDIDGDGRDDLALLGTSSATVMLGAAHGLTSIGAQVWDATSSGIAGALRKPGSITAIALGDVNGDGHADLALGSPEANSSNVPFDDCNSEQLCDGAVAILPGTADRYEPITAAGRQIVTWNTPGVYQSGSGLGRALAVGDVDGDGRDELCIAGGNRVVPRVVKVLHFAAAGAIRSDAVQSFAQTPGQVSGTFEQDDAFADAMQVAQLGRGSQGDLVIGVPGATVDGKAAAGRVVVLYGTGDGLAVDGQQSWSQSSPGVRGGAEPGDRFGTLGHWRP